MPGVERLQDRFRSAHTQVLGISVDSHFTHAGWAVSLGGISFPLLADFHEKGAVAKDYGLFLDAAGITDRATVIIDADGVVQHASSVTPAGSRDIEELAGLCEGVDKAYSGSLADYSAADSLESDATLYVKSSCGFSVWAMQARENLHLQDRVALKNVSEDADAAKKLNDAGGKDQAPCLVVGGKAIFESADIIRHLVSATTDIAG